MTALMRRACRKYAAMTNAEQASIRSDYERALHALEDIKRLYLVGDLNTDEARALDQFWRRRLCCNLAYVRALRAYEARPWWRRLLQKRLETPYGSYSIHSFVDPTPPKPT
jgi:hypothetical protein